MPKVVVQKSRISKAAAIEAAKAAILNLATDDQPRARPGYKALGSTVRPVWRVEFAAAQPAFDFRTDVDARSGKVISRVNLRVTDSGGIAGPKNLGPLDKKQVTPHRLVRLLRPTGRAACLLGNRPIQGAPPMRKLISTFVIGLAVAGCDPAQPTKGNAADLTAFCKSYDTAFLNYLSTCIHADKDVLASKLTVDCSVQAKEVTAGRVNFDPSKSSACLAAVSAAPCSGGFAGVVLEAFPACAGLVTGTIAVGGSCYVDDDCTSVACERSGNSCPGTCKAVAKVGDSCASGSCPKNSYCGQNICVGLSTAGGACGDGHHFCADGFNCPSNVCVARPTSGACDDSSVYCAFGYACSSGTCKQLVAVGGDCSSDAKLCSIGDYCKTGRCAPDLTIGTACDPSLDKCAFGFCSSSSHVCTAGLAGGAACSAGEQCNSLSCNSSSNTCDAAPVGCSPP